MIKTFTTVLLALGLAFLCLPAAAQEVEPNNTTATAQPLDLGEAMTGQVTALDDADYFAVELAAGAYRIEFEYPGADPAPRDWWTVRDANGDEIEEFYCYYPNGLHTMLFKVCETGTFYVHVSANRTFNTLTGANYRFLLQPDTEDPAECNDIPRTARILDAPSTLTGKIIVPGDVDFIRINNAAPGLFLASVNVPAGGPDFALTLYANPNQTPLASANGGSLETGLPAAGTYYLRIAYQNPDTSSFQPYIASIAYLTAASCDITLDATAIQTTAPECGQPNGGIAIPTPTSGVAPFLYSINGGETLPSGTFTNLEGGSYTIAVVDAEGCTYEDTIDLACVDCQDAVAGISFTYDSFGFVNFIGVVQNGTITGWNFGDGGSSTEASPTYQYMVNGSYTVTLTAVNDCGAVTTATVGVIILNGDFELVRTEGAAGEVVSMALRSVNFDGPIVYVFASMVFDPTVATFEGFRNGRLAMSTGAYNPANTTFSYLFNSAGSETVVPGDTLFSLDFRLVGNPGDSTEVNFDNFEIGGLVAGVARAISGSLSPAVLAIYANIPLRIDVHTPYNLPISNAEVTITTADTTILGVTNENGLLELEVPYSTQVTVRVAKDTLIRSNISPADAFYFNRLIVGLAIPGLTPYTHVAGDLDCNGTFTTLDVVQHLQWLVGLIEFPCASGQIVMIPASHTMPAYPSPDYFNYPTEMVIDNPDPRDGVLASFIGVVRSDADGNANPGFTDGDERTFTEHQWQSQQYRHADGTLRVRLLPEAFQALIGGLVALEFDAHQAQYLGHTWLGGQAQLAVNEQLAARGLLKMAFIGQQEIATAPGSGLVELIFDTDADAIDMKVDENSRVFDADGQANRLSIHHNQLPNDATAASLSPNPNHGTFVVALPNSTDATTLSLYNARGASVLRTNVAHGQQIDANHLPAGVYFWRLTTGQTGKMMIKQ